MKTTDKTCEDYLTHLEQLPFYSCYKCSIGHTELEIETSTLNPVPQPSIIISLKYCTYLNIIRHSVRLADSGLAVPLDILVDMNCDIHLKSLKELYNNEIYEIYNPRVLEEIEKFLVFIDEENRIRETRFKKHLQEKA